MTEAPPQGSPAGTWSYLRKVRPLLSPYQGLAGASVLIMLVGTALGLLAPWPMKLLIDHVLGSAPLPAALARWLGHFAAQPLSLLIVIVVAGLFLTIVQGALGVLDGYVNTKISRHIVLDFRGRLFEHVQRLSLTYHDKTRSSDLIFAVNSRSDSASGLVMAVAPLTRSAITLLGMFWITFSIDAGLALLALTVVPFLYFSARRYIAEVQDPLWRVKRMESESMSLVAEAMTMLRVILAFGREDHELRRFRASTRRAVDARVAVTVRQTLFSLAVNTTTATGTSLVLGYGAYRVLQGQLTLGSLLVVLAYVAGVYRPIEAISTTVGSLQDHVANLREVFGVLEAEPDIRDLPESEPMERALGRIEFQDVSFGYPGRGNAVHEVSFDVPAGRAIAIVGPTGAGKTTLHCLLSRFYDPQKGRILLDGRDVRNVTLASLRQQMSIVMQEPLLFSETIAANIRYGRLDADMDAIIEAARAANAHGFISSLPDGYETWLGERGTRLSGGERQRIAIARAFLRNAPLLILDEPTSSIDSRTEAVILEALDRLMAGRTTVMVAHRLSTVRHADRILVLNEGRLVEQGTFTELIEAKGLFEQLWRIQSQPGTSGVA